MTTDQPDGICADHEDDFRIPAPAAAAKRVDEFVRWFGDGEVFDRTDLGGEATDTPPLYARDLCALVCAVLHGYRADSPSRCRHERTAKPAPSDAKPWRSDDPAPTLATEAAHAQACDAYEAGRRDGLAVTAEQDAAPRPFQIHRDTDVSGVSGTGVVADGVEFPDGSVALRWRGDWPTSVVFHDRGIRGVEAIHGHGGATRVVWLDALTVTAGRYLVLVEDMKRALNGDMTYAESDWFVLASVALATLGVTVTGGEGE